MTSKAFVSLTSSRARSEAKNLVGLKEKKKVDVSAAEVYCVHFKFQGSRLSQHLFNLKSDDCAKGRKKIQVHVKEG